MSRYHVYGVGNALVDMEYEISVDELNSLGVEKGVMTLIEQDRQQELLAKLEDLPGSLASGGSAANTVIAVAQLGGKAFYSCKVANDETGTFYMNDLQECGVDSNIEVDNREPGITGKCLVLVTPDADRTLNTFLGITGKISDAELNEEAIKSSQYVYLEGYLVPEPTACAAAVKARKIAEAAGVKTALTLSDPNMVKFFKDQLLEIAGDNLDLLFCNDDEAKLMCETDDIDECFEKLKEIADTFAITLGAQGALLFDGTQKIQLPAEKVKALDTNGAGDMYAGAFLYGITHGMDFETAGRLASSAAGRLVTHFGPRLPQDELQQVFKDFMANNVA